MLSFYLGSTYCVTFTLAIPTCLSLRCSVSVLLVVIFVYFTIVFLTCYDLIPYSIVWTMSISSLVLRLARSGHWCLCSSGTNIIYPIRTKIFVQKLPKMFQSIAYDNFNEFHSRFVPLLSFLRSRFFTSTSQACHWMTQQNPSEEFTETLLSITRRTIIVEVMSYKTNTI